MPPVAPPATAPGASPRRAGIGPPPPPMRRYRDAGDACRPDTPLRRRRSVGRCDSVPTRSPSSPATQPGDASVEDVHGRLSGSLGSLDDVVSLSAIPTQPPPMAWYRFTEVFRA